MNVENDGLTEKIIGAAIMVHRYLGPGLLESTYEVCMEYELRDLGLLVERQKELPVIYKGIPISCGYRLDLVVENRVIIELKSVEALNSLHMAQVLSYLKLSGLAVGLLINFNVLKLTDGIKRVVHRY